MARSMQQGQRQLWPAIANLGYATRRLSRVLPGGPRRAVIMEALAAAMELLAEVAAPPEPHFVSNGGLAKYTALATRQPPRQVGAEAFPAPTAVGAEACTTPTITCQPPQQVGAEAFPAPTVVGAEACTTPTITEPTVLKTVVENASVDDDIRETGVDVPAVFLNEPTVVETVVENASVDDDIRETGVDAPAVFLNELTVVETVVENASVDDDIRVTGVDAPAGFMQDTVVETVVDFASVNAGIRVAAWSLTGTVWAKVVKEFVEEEVEAGCWHLSTEDLESNRKLLARLEELGPEGMYRAELEGKG